MHLFPLRTQKSSKGMRGTSTYCNTLFTSDVAAKTLIPGRKALRTRPFCADFVAPRRRRYHETAMSLPDTIFIFALALVIFGPKKLPEIGRQLGKLVLEFRRASNEFKMQIEEELRNAEEQERQKQLTAQTAAASTSSSSTDTPEAAVATSSEESSLSVRPPSTGTQVSADSPFGAVPVEPPTESTTESSVNGQETTPPSSTSGNEMSLMTANQNGTTANQEGLEEQTTHHHG
jgi:sec-independent protein translocase protein TatB